MKAPRSSTSSSDTASPEARGRRALVACGWALLLVVTLDLSCRVLLPAGWLVEQEDIIRARVESQPAPDVQVVGDSVARSGLLASALVDDGLVARNDAIPAGGTPKTYLLLARQFAEGRIPKALVIAHSPHTFGQIRYEVLIGSFAHWSEVPSLVVQSDSWTDALYGVFTRLSWILMHRDSLRDLITKGDTSFFADAKVPHYFPPDTDRVASYAQDAAKGRYDTSVLRPGITDSYTKPFVVKEMNDYYFRQILSLARSKGVAVFWITLPSPARVIEARAALGYEADMLAYLRPFEQRGDLTILRGEFVEYPDSMFRDLLHLNDAGSVRFACEFVQFKPKLLAAVRAGNVEPDGTAGSPSESQAVASAFAGALAPLCGP
jgi:hypothetical protein